MFDADKTGVDVTGAADQNAGDNAGVAGQQQTGDTTVAAGQTDAEKGQLAALEAERKKRQDAEKQVQDLQQQFQILQANLQRQQQPAQQSQSTIGRLGINKDDLITGEQAEQIVQQVQRQTQMTQQQARILTFINQHPDYSEKVGQFNITGQFIPAEPLRLALQANPDLIDRLNDPILAYEIANSYLTKTELEKERAANKEREAQQKVNQQTAPMSSVAAGGAGAVNLAAQIGDLSNPEHLRRLAILDAEVMSGKHG